MAKKKKQSSHFVRGVRRARKKVKPRNPKKGHAPPRLIATPLLQAYEFQDKPEPARPAVNDALEYLEPLPL